MTLTPDGFDNVTGRRADNDETVTTYSCPEGEKRQHVTFDSDSNQTTACGGRIYWFSAPVGVLSIIVPTFQNL